MTTKYYLNEELSKSIYFSNQELIVKKECYNNIFRLISSDIDILSMISKRAWKIAYGSMLVSPEIPIQVRHCFLLDENNQVIDPTLINLQKDTDGIFYHVAFTFDSMAAYTDAILKNDLQPDLDLLYSNEWRKFETELFQLGTICIA